MPTPSDSFQDFLFIAVTFACVFFIHFAVWKATQPTKSRLAFYVGILLMVWMLIAGFLSTSGFLQDFETMPPKIMFLVVPALLSTVIMAIIPRSRQFLLKLPITTLTYMHIIRVPVEICLWWLYKDGLVAREMTFEGANHDIISGITAPFAAVFLVGKKRKNKWIGIVWNLVCLGLLINIVTRAISLMPYFYDPSSGELMNMAVFYFPYIWLPAFVVPAVFFAHVVSLLQLFRKQESVS